MTAYDNATGKITLHADKPDNAYMMIKEVPVFVQMQVGNQMVTASKTLTVSTRAFVDEIEFGGIEKDGTKRDDGRLTITELSSGKYYVELDSVKDQYGNTLSADDLNDQKGENVLFVIPGDSGAFYVTGKFGTVKDKTVLWLAAPAAGAKPGTMTLTITGAGGKTFTKDITIEDDPYIDNITVTYPELYAGAGKSNSLDFTAVDQYGNPIDLWQFKPYVTGVNDDTLVFTDENHMTNEPTKMVISNAKFNVVTENSAKKTFEVTVDTSTSQAKSMVVFTTTTAGTKVFTASRTVGETGVAVKVKSPATASTQLDQASGWTKGSATSLNFNSTAQFEDINGNTMVRGKDALYPYFTNANLKVKKTDSDIKPKDYKTFAWTVTSAKIPDNTDTTAKTITALLNGKGVIDDNGVIYADDFVTKNDYYVTVFGSTVADAGNADDWYMLDTQDFHVTEVVGFDKDTKYSIVAPGTLYVAKDSKHSVKVKVKATTDNGETYEVAGDRISLTLDSRWTVSNNEVKGKVADGAVSGSGSVEATVWVDCNGSKVEAGTVAIPYSDAKPVATKAELGWKASSAGSFATSREGDKISGSVSDIELGDEGTNVPVATIEKGVLTITNGTSLNDTITAQIKDQYGVAMTDTKFFLDGTEIADGNTIASGYRGAIEYRSGNVTNKFYFTATNGTGLVFATDADDQMTNLEVASQDELTTAVAVAKANPELNYTIKATKSFNTGAATPIPANATFVIPADIVLGVGHTLTVSGSLKVEGTVMMTVANAIKAQGVSLETSGSGAILTDGTGTAAVTAGKVTLGGSGGASIDTVATAGDVTISAGTNDITTSLKTTGTAKITISGGTNTIADLVDTAGAVSIKGGDTTITTLTESNGAITVDGGDLAIGTFTACTGKITVTAGTLDLNDQAFVVANAAKITVNGGILDLTDMIGVAAGTCAFGGTANSTIILPDKVNTAGDKITFTKGFTYTLFVSGNQTIAGAAVPTLGYVANATEYTKALELTGNAITVAAWTVADNV